MLKTHLIIGCIILRMHVLIFWSIVKRIFPVAKWITRVQVEHANFLDILVSWFNKKQNCVALHNKSIVYCREDVLCPNIMERQTLKDYNIQFDTTCMLCDKFH